MDAGFLIIVALLIIGAIIFFTTKDDSHKTEKPTESMKPVEPVKPVEPTSGLKINIPNVEPVTKPVAHITVHQKSLDMIYAETHDMWSCSHCETLNDNWSVSCIACGAGKYER